MKIHNQGRVGLAGLLVLQGLIIVASAANEPATISGKKVSDPLVPILGLKTQVEPLKQELDQLAAGYATGLNVDTDRLQRHITEMAAEHGWTAEMIAEKVAKTIEEAEKKINAEIPSFLTKATTAITASAVAAADKLDPKAKFQADFRYTEGQPDQNVWSRGACNLESQAVKASIEGTGAMGFRAGVAAGLMADIDFEVEVMIRGSLSVESFNPVGPVDGNGRTITIVATPIWRNSKGGSVGATAFMKIVIAADVEGTGTLPDIEDTLSI